MPLERGAKPGSEGFGKNVATEVRAGKPEKQALAIAYREARADSLSASEIARTLQTLRTALARAKKMGDAKAVERLEKDVRAWAAKNPSRADALQPSPFASRLTAFEVGLDYLSSRLDALAP